MTITKTLYQQMSGTDEERIALVERYAAMPRREREAFYEEAREALHLGFQEVRQDARYCAGLERAAAAGGLNASNRARSAAEGRVELRSMGSLYDVAARTKTALSILVGYGDPTRHLSYAAAGRTVAGEKLVDAVVVRAIDLRRAELGITPAHLEEAGRAKG